jgi:arylsulfatase A-like enzyme
MPLNRRHFLWSVLAAPALAASKKQPPLERPNILIVTADGLGAYMLGCYANTEIRTPNIDRLSQTGVRFTNAFASTPAAPEPGPRDAALSDALSGAGYNVNSGNGSGTEFLDAQTPAKPFFLTLTWPSPASVTVAQKDVDQYAKTSFEAMGWEPAAPNATHKDILRDVPGNLRKYAAGITTLDGQLAGLSAKLQQRNLWENTLVIFTSSHGFLAGHHGLWGDGTASDPVNMYEEVERVPLIWTWPSRFPPQTVRNDVVSSNDLLPTLCDLTHATPPAAANRGGQSYLTFVYGRRLPKKQSWHDVVFARLRNTEMARDDRYKLVLRDQGKGASELYDEVTDAAEKENQYDNPQYVNVRDRLTAALAAWRVRSGG